MTAERDSMTLSEVSYSALGPRSVATRPQGRERKIDPGPGGRGQAETRGARMLNAKSRAKVVVQGYPQGGHG